VAGDPKTKTAAPAESRRRFLQRSAAGVALFHIVPAHVLGGPNRVPPSEKINVACIGVGGRGEASVDACRNEYIVALADVDDARAADAYKKNPKAERFRDFRKMLDSLDGKIDAVTVGTPDHTHAVAVTDALRRGKHVYCEKPLAHTIDEIRAISKLAREKGVVTQLGNQGHSSEEIRSVREWILDGAIGEVTEVHACCDAFPNVYCQIDKLPQLAEKHETPTTLDYDLWLGPTAERAYSPLWVPWNWRGWLPFGTGCIGDWVCHVVDPSFWALDLGAPTSIVAAVDASYDPEKHALVYPPGTKITYEFPAKGKRGPVKFIWFDGKMRPPSPETQAGLEGVRSPGTGAVLYGKDGAIVHGSHGAGGRRLLPESRAKDYKEPPKSIPRVRGHHEDWLDSIRAGRKAGSDFDAYGASLTEIGLLGAIAIRFPGKELRWDSAAMRFTNHDAANAYVTSKYRSGWEL
jgi:predicted dehydrogenase